ncbi:MAG: DUF2442 domain-containing protein [Ignavibacteriae bacterium]|nr:DUF2442 domain-containing protein [Ignavibacteriota bacterium]
MKNYPKILEVTVKRPYIIEIVFESNQIKQYDFKNLLNDSNFTKLKNFSYFKNLKVSVGGYGIEWDDELDLSESELWLNGQIVS